MFNLAQLYQPITARPEAANEFLPCEALRPYIRCFWGSEPAPPAAGQDSVVAEEAPGMATAATEVVIPDTCMDIIMNVDGSTGGGSIFFSGINDAPFEVPRTAEKPGSSTFAIRFHFWAVHYFADEHLRDVLNAHTEVEQYFSTFRRELGELLSQTTSMGERIAAAEAYLLRRLRKGSRTNDSMMNAVHMILKRRGIVTARELQDGSGLGSRQLERLFNEYIGVTPKKAADLVRFQHAWQELYRPSPQVRGMQDIVFAYQYSHQSHFINTFKRYAGRTPLEALAYARR